MWYFLNTFWILLGNFFGYFWRLFGYFYAAFGILWETFQILFDTFWILFGNFGIFSGYLPVYSPLLPFLSVFSIFPSLLFSSFFPRYPRFFLLLYVFPVSSHFTPFVLDLLFNSILLFEKEKNYKFQELIIKTLCIDFFFI